MPVWGETARKGDPVVAIDPGLNSWYASLSFVYEENPWLNYQKSILFLNK
jgi:hypothetical protein